MKKRRFCLLQEVGGYAWAEYQQFSTAYTESQDLPRRAFGASAAFDGDRLLVGDPLLDVWKVLSLLCLSRACLGIVLTHTLSPNTNHAVRSDP